ncbi:phosphotransferase family protein [Nocardioides pacificus]
MDPLSSFASLAPLPGGWSGQTFLADAGGERSVVRIYARPGERGAVAHEVDAAVLGLVRGLLPVPRVLEVRRADAATGLPALLVTTYLPGESGEQVLADLAAAGDAEGLATRGRALGGLAASLAAMPLLRRGAFLDAELRIGPRGSHPADLGSLVDASEEALVGRPYGESAAWTAAELAGLRAVAEDAQALLDTAERACLVHGDLTPANVLVDPGTGEVLGLIDWELAHAGHPFTDLGSLLRHDRHPSYVDAALAAWTDRHGGARRETLELARAADLAALLRLATSSEPTPPTVAASGLLRAIARTGDLDAGPEQA